MMFYILISLLWPSIACALFLLYHFIHSAHLRNKPRNRIILCLIVVNFIQEIIELPPCLYLLYTGAVLFPNPIFCQLWNWCQFTLVSINQFIMAIARFEHYLFIFHRVFLTQHTFLLRQLPVVLCIILPTIFYAVSIYIPLCTTIFDYTRVGCGLPCFFITNQFAIIFKNIIIVSLPVIMIIILNIFIFIRILIQQKKMKRHRICWHENIRMVSQLLPLAVLYSVIWIPLSVLFYFNTLGNAAQKLLANLLINDYFANLKYLINFFCSFLILMGQSELREKILKVFSCFYCRPRQHVAVVAPMPINS